MPAGSSQGGGRPSVQGSSGQLQASGHGAEHGAMRTLCLFLAVLAIVSLSWSISGLSHQLHNGSVEPVTLPRQAVEAPTLVLPHVQGPETSTEAL